MAQGTQSPKDYCHASAEIRDLQACYILTCISKEAKSAYFCFMFELNQDTNLDISGPNLYTDCTSQCLGGIPDLQRYEHWTHAMERVQTLILGAGVSGLSEIQAFFMAWSLGGYIILILFPYMKWEKSIKTGPIYGNCEINQAVEMKREILSSCFLVGAAKVVGLACARALARRREVVLCDLSNAFGTGVTQWENSGFVGFLPIFVALR